MRHANLLNTGASALALAVLLGACSPQTPAADPAAPSAAPAAAPAGDGTATLTPQQWRSLGMAAAPSASAAHQPLPGLAAQAMLPLQASVQVAAPYGGVATQVLVDEGASVRAGQVLARIHSRELLAARGELARARSEATAAEQAARRDATLLAEGVIAAARHEQAQARLASARSALLQADKAVAGVGTSASGAGGEYELVAPVAGQVVRRQLQRGQSLAALETAFELAQPGVMAQGMELRFAAPLRWHAALVPGLPVRLPDGSQAQVVAVGADADPASQSLWVRARTQPGAQPLVAGQQFNVSLLLPVPPGALRVPSSALLPAGEGHVLYAVVAGQAGQDTARVRGVAVQLLADDGTDSVVLPAKGQSLAPDTPVVTRGTALLKAMLAQP